MTTYLARPAAEQRHRLAEGPVWDPAVGALWVDILAGEVHEGRLNGGRVEPGRRLQVDTMVGAAVRSADGRLLVAGLERLWVVDAGGQIAPAPRILAAGSGRRLNDGACDPAGRFVVGTLSLATPSTTEVLVRVEEDGSLTVLDDDLAQSNGLAWSADGGTLFSIDTVPGLVWARDYDAVTGAVGERRLHLHVDGYPDGMSSDTDGNLWVAVWGAGQVRCHAPDGALLHVVDVPAPHTSSVAFAGHDLRTLIVTTAAAELTADQLTRFPLSGRLFTVDVEATGVPSTPWNGRLPSPGPRRSEH